MKQIKVKPKFNKDDYVVIEEYGEGSEESLPPSLYQMGKVTSLATIMVQGYSDLECTPIYRVTTIPDNQIKEVPETRVYTIKQYSDKFKDIEMLRKIKEIAEEHSSEIQLIHEEYSIAYEQTESDEQRENIYQQLIEEHKKLGVYNTRTKKPFGF